MTDQYTITLQDEVYNISMAETTLSANVVRYQTGSGSPAGSVTPASVPALYVDTATGITYIAVDSSSSDWKRIFTQ